MAWVTVLAVAQSNAAAQTHASSVTLMPPRSCLVGNNPTQTPARPEVRVQFGVFRSWAGAEAQVAQLARRRIAAEMYLAPEFSGDAEVFVVVSEARYTTFSQARTVVVHMRRRGLNAFARTYRVPTT